MRSYAAGGNDAQQRGGPLTRDGDGELHCPHCGGVVEGKGAEQSKPVDKRRPDLATRVALRPPEAAAALGVCGRTFRDLLPELPHIRRGNMVLVPVDALREWLRREAEVHHQTARAMAGALVAELGGPQRRAKP